MKKLVNGVVMEMSSEEIAAYDKWKNELSDNSGGVEDEWELITHQQYDSPASEIEITVNDDGQPFKYKAIRALVNFISSKPKGELTFVPGKYWGSGETYSYANLSNEWTTTVLTESEVFDSRGVFIRTINLTNTLNSIGSCTYKAQDQNAKYEYMQKYYVYGDIGAGTSLLLFGKK